MPAFVEGRRLVAPQTVSVIKEEVVVGNQPPTPLVVAVIGTCDGGLPRTFQEFYSFTEARQALRSGQLIDLLRRVYGPAQGEPGAYKTIVYRLNDAAAASAVLKDAAAANVIALQSRDYGLHTNQIRYKVEAGTTAGSYKATVQGFDGAAAVTRDNIQRPILTVQYTGGATTANLTISDASFDIAPAGGTFDPAEAVTLAYTSYPTVQSIVDALVSKGVYSVTLLADGRLPSNQLDRLTGGDVIDTKAAPRTVKANVQALIDWFNNEEPFIVASRAAAGSGKAVATSASFASLTGGNNGAAVNSTDYQNALAALQAEECDLVVVGSEDAAIHAMVDAHCHLMSQIGANKERIGIVGGVAGETPAATIARAAALNSFRMALCYPGLKDTDELGQPVTLSPAYTAAAVAGLVAGQTVGTPATRRPLRCIGPERRLTPTEIDDLLTGGVLPVEAHATEGARVVQSLLTYTTQQAGGINVLRHEMSSRIAADRLIKRVRERLDAALIGEASGPLLREQARSLAESELALAQDDGLIVGDSDNPAYQDVSATVANQTVTVTFRAAVVAPGNYVIIRASLGTYNS